MKVSRAEPFAELAYALGVQFLHAGGLIAVNLDGGMAIEHFDLPDSKIIPSLHKTFCINNGLLGVIHDGNDVFITRRDSLDGTDGLSQDTLKQKLSERGYREATFSMPFHLFSHVIVGRRSNSSSDSGITQNVFDNAHNILGVDEIAARLRVPEGIPNRRQQVWLRALNGIAQ